MQEQIILNKTGWGEKELQFYGSLIYNVIDENKKSVADIVSRRDSKEISIDWFIPNKEGEKISLVFDVTSQSINAEKTDSEVKTQKDIEAFLNTISNTIKDTTPQFFPSKKIENKGQKISL